MFLTNTADRAIISDLLGDTGQTYSTAAELALNVSWFLVELRQIERPDHDEFGEINRTLFLTNLADVENLVQSQTAELIIEAVYIVMPKNVNGSNYWRMEPLVAVWTAEEPLTPGLMVDLYEVRGGCLYANSYLETPIIGFRKRSLRFEIPLKNFDPSELLY